MEEDLDAPHRDSGGVSGALTFDGKHNNTMRSDVLPHQQSLGVTSYFNNDLAELPVGVLRHPEADGEIHLRRTREVHAQHGGMAKPI